MSDLKHLEETLAIYGSDVTRWPSERRDALASLVDRPETKALFAEAQALERLLDAGAGDDAPSDEAMASLLSDIMAATVDAALVETTVSRSRAVGSARSTRNRTWIGGVSMAAALLVGIFAGMNGFGAVVTQSGISFAQGEPELSADESLLADLSLSSDVDFGDDV